MEAGFFRFLAAELGSTLPGRRIDKVFAPAPDVWTFKLQAAGNDPYLILRPAKSAGLLFCSALKPANPKTAPARAMWFRKRLSGRRILGCRADWPGLRLALSLSPRDEPADSGEHLVLDVRNGPSLVRELPPEFETEPGWPTLAEALGNDGIWREHPQISPPLRKRLAELDQGRAEAFYRAVQSDHAAAFYLPMHGETPGEPLIWRPDADEVLEFDSALACASAQGERVLYPLLETADGREHAQRAKALRKKIKRNLAKVEQEHDRLRTLIDQKTMAEALQAELWRIKDEEGLEEVVVQHPEQGPLTVPLNPHMSPTENMERYFKLAAKGRRGLPHLARRRTELLAEMDRADELARQSAPAERRASATPTAPKKFKGLAVQVFTSSDGLTILRGKNAQANSDMLSRAASGFDYWLHAASGPSSHVIIKRDHPAQEVPERTLDEAAVLCALKSHASGDAKADVMVALVKNVRKVKGFKPGQVTVDEVIATRRVELDPDVERRLS